MIHLNFPEVLRKSAEMLFEDWRCSERSEHCATTSLAIYRCTGLLSRGEKKESYSAVIRKEEDVDLNYHHVPTLQFLKLLSNLSSMS
jgi:hypothetical protein